MLSHACASARRCGQTTSHACAVSVSTTQPRYTSPPAFSHTARKQVTPWQLSKQRSGFAMRCRYALVTQAQSGLCTRCLFAPSPLCCCSRKAQTGGRLHQRRRCGEGVSQGDVLHQRSSLRYAGYHPGLPYPCMSNATSLHHVYIPSCACCVGCCMRHRLWPKLCAGQCVALAASK